MPCKESRARRLLKAKKAKVYRIKPFTIILTEREGGDVQETELKLDPGSKTTGIALVADFKHRGQTLLWSANLNHRGQMVKKNLDSRRASRRGRRARKTRYRQARFLNREIPKGWKFNRTCVYCQKTGVPLEIEHIIPKSRGGTNRVSNLTIACKPCNDKKGSKTAKEFGFSEVEKQCKNSLKDVRAIVLKGKKLGKYTGKVAVRASGSFNITTRGGTIQGIGWKNCKMLQKVDGYAYS